MLMSNSVEPRLSRGLRDLLPNEMLARQQMVDTIRRVYESYGFVPISTPAVEFLDVLSGSAGAEAQSSIFRVTNPEQEALGRWQRLSAWRKGVAIGSFAVGTFGLGFTLGGLVFGKWRKA